VNPSKKPVKVSKMPFVRADYYVFCSTIGLIPISGLSANLTTGNVNETLILLQVTEAVVVIY
jgi:hypothetical protein